MKPYKGSSTSSTNIFLSTVPLFMLGPIHECMFCSSDRERKLMENMPSADFHFLIYKYFLSRSATHHYPTLNSLQNVTLLDKWCC